MSSLQCLGVILEHTTKLFDRGVEVSVRSSQLAVHGLASVEKVVRHCGKIRQEEGYLASRGISRVGCSFLAGVGCQSLALILQVTIFHVGGHESLLESPTSIHRRSHDSRRVLRWADPHRATSSPAGVRQHVRRSASLILNTTESSDKEKGVGLKRHRPRWLLLSGRCRLPKSRITCSGHLHISSGGHRGRSKHPRRHDRRRVQRGWCWADSDSAVSRPSSSWCRMSS